MMNKKGFSLIELLVVIVLIAIISIVAFVNFGNQAPKGRNTMRINNLGNIQTAIEFQKADAQVTTVKGATAGGVAMADGVQVATKYLAKVPTDPKGGTAFRYGANDPSDSVATTYQVAASLEALADSPTSLGSYNLTQARAALVGTFLPTSAATIASDGVVSFTSTGAASTAGLIAPSANIAGYTAATNVSAAPTVVVIDNGANLPY